MNTGEFVELQAFGQLCQIQEWPRELNRPPELVFRGHGFFTAEGAEKEIIHIQEAVRRFRELKAEFAVSRK